MLHLKEQGTIMEEMKPGGDHWLILWKDIELSENLFVKKQCQKRKHKNLSVNNHSEEVAESEVEWTLRAVVLKFNE